jgi:hypothetical protein
LVAGLHRLEAFRKLDHDRIPCLILSMTEDDARMWEIAENLHRAELTVQERADHIKEWIDLCEKGISSQVATKPKGGRPQSGVNAASPLLGISKDQAHRAVKIASISPEAKVAAAVLGIDDNQSKLLAVATVPAPQQAEMARKVASNSNIKENPRASLLFNRLNTNWKNSPHVVRRLFLSNIDLPNLIRQAFHDYLPTGQVRVDGDEARVDDLIARLMAKLARSGS